MADSRERHWTRGGSSLVGGRRSCGVEGLLDFAQAQMGGGELARLGEHFVFQPSGAVGEGRHLAHRLAELVNLAGPARLVLLFTVFGPLGPFECDAQLFAQLLGAEVGAGARCLGRRW